MTDRETVEEAEVKKALRHLGYATADTPNAEHLQTVARRMDELRRERDEARKWEDAGLRCYYRSRDELRRLRARLGEEIEWAVGQFEYIECGDCGYGVGEHTDDFGCEGDRNVRVAQHSIDRLRSALDSREDEGGDSSVSEGQEKSLRIGVHWCPNGETLRRYPAVVCSMCRPSDPNVVHYGPVHADEPEGDEAEIVDTPTPDGCPGVVVGWQGGGKSVVHPPGADCPVHSGGTSYGRPTDEPVSGEGDEPRCAYCGQTEAAHAPRFEPYHSFEPRGGDNG